VLGEDLARLLQLPSHLRPEICWNQPRTTGRGRGPTATNHLSGNSDDCLCQRLLEPGCNIASFRWLRAYAHHTRFSTRFHVGDNARNDDPLSKASHFVKQYSKASHFVNQHVRLIGDDGLSHDFRPGRDVTRRLGLHYTRWYFVTWPQQNCIDRQRVVDCGLWIAWFLHCAIASS
jgi:hypothetical protein